MAPFLAPVDDLHPRHVKDLDWLTLCLLLLLLLMLGTQQLRGSGSCLHVAQTACNACKIHWAFSISFLRNAPVVIQYLLPQRCVCCCAVLLPVRCLFRLLLLLLLLLLNPKKISYPQPKHIHGHHFSNELSLPYMTRVVVWAGVAAMHTDDPVVVDVVQFRHLADPLVGAYVPIAHGVHTSLPYAEKVPAVQFVHMVCPLYCE
jgi:hypothetical protein